MVNDIIINIKCGLLVFFHDAVDGSGFVLCQDGDNYKLMLRIIFSMGCQSDQKMVRGNKIPAIP